MALYRNPVSGWVETRRNLVGNPEFAAGISGWRKYWVPTHTWITDPNAYPGGNGRSLEVKRNGTDANQGAVAATDGAAPAAGALVRATIRIKAAPGATVLSGIAIHSGTAVGKGAWVGDGQWREVIAERVWTGTETSFAVQVNIVNSDTFADGDVLCYIDSAMLEVNTTGPYFSGATADDAAHLYEWTGAVNGSASTLSIPNAASTIPTVLNLRPYEARREARTVAHTLLDDQVTLFSHRIGTASSGVFKFLFDNYWDAKTALDALAIDPRWTWYDTTDSGVTEVPFVVAGGDVELVQDIEVPNLWVVSVPYVEATA